MHTHQNSYFREHRHTYFHSAEIPLAGMEAAAVTGETHSLLNGLKNSIALPSETVSMAAEKVALTGIAAMNVALLGGVFASGLYMILAGKTPPFLRNLNGK